jgi:hypothetical protein
MTRPQPRLPELAGMTEAGFNRVVAMIQLRDFGVPVSSASEQRYRDWRASLPKTRNKRQRKADAKRTALHESTREQFEAIFPPVHCCVCEKKLELFDEWARDGRRCCCSCAHGQQTPLQRLLTFAAEDGTPVSFEIAEKAMRNDFTPESDP